MDKQEILDKSRKSLIHGDEREHLINGRANTVAKCVFTVTIILFILFNNSRGMDSNDLWTIFFVYCASESLYKYYCLKEKKILITGILFTLIAIYSLIIFFIHNV
jgi:hypothetical protein